MLKKSETIAPTASQPPASETADQRFERILLRPQFNALKSVFGHLGTAAALMQGAIVATNSYENFLSKLGFRLIVVKQLHENDCYTRLGPKGGIRAVLPVHDTTNYSTMVTLVNFDSTVTTTANSVEFYDDQLREFKIQLMNRSGDAR